MQRILDRVATLFVVVASIAVIGAGVERWFGPFGRNQRPPLTERLPLAEIPQHPVPLDGLPSVGVDSAPVLLLEVTDFACPFCARFDETTWPRIRREFIDTGIVKSSFLVAPDPQKPFAEAAAALSVCMASDVNFSEIRESLFSLPKPIFSLVLDDRAAATGLDSDALDRCRTGFGLQQVRANRSMAEALSVPGTPTFYIGRMDSSRGYMRVLAAIVGLRPFDDFAAAFRDAQRSE